MTFEPHPLDQQRSSLLIEPESLGEGGQGVVKRVLGPGRLVYKEYMPQAGIVNGNALSDLVDFGQSLPPVDQHLLLAHCAWPVARVLDGSRITGFLMPQVPDAFYGSIGGESTLVELQYLLFKPNWAWEDLHAPDIRGRLEVALLSARMVDFLHGHGIVLGDISFRNLLWKPSSPYRIFVLDCDGFRRHGGEPVLRQAHTPDWDDPQQLFTGSDLDTDRYKLALLIGRILSRNAQVRPGEELKLLLGLELHAATQITDMFARADGPHGSRPIASEWAQALLGRKWIRVRREPPRDESSKPEPASIYIPGSGRSQQPVSPPASPPSSESSEPPLTPDVGIPLPPSVSVTASANRSLGERVIASDIYLDQREITPSLITDHVISKLIDGLASSGGRLPTAAVAKLLGEPAETTPLLVGAAKPLLNVDGVIALTLKDGDQTVDLNLRLLKEQFLDEEGGP